MPPRKKYQTIIISQPGVLSIAASVPPVAKRQERSQSDHERRADREQRVDDHVPLRQLGSRGQVVRRRRRQEQEEGVQAAEKALVVGAVEVRLLEAEPLERLHALLRLGHQLVAEPELDRVRGARLGAGGPEAVVDAVVTERALLRGAR